MNRKSLIALGILGTAIIVVAVISWFAIPAWQTMQGGGWLLIGAVVIGVVPLMGGILGIMKTAGELGADDAAEPDTGAITHAEGERSVSIGGNANHANILTGDKNKVEQKGKK